MQKRIPTSSPTLDATVLFTVQAKPFPNQIGREGGKRLFSILTFGK